MKTLFFLLAAVSAAFANDAATALLTGRVLDPSRASVPGATVQVTNQGTGQTLTTVADPLGKYAFRLTAVGSYAISVEAPGFETFSRSDLVLNAGQTTALDVALDVAALAEQVTVAARAPDMVEALEIRQVRESSARDVGEALTAVEGLWKIRRAGVANDVIVRGFQQENITVLIDGARIYGACPGNMDPPVSHVDFAEIQQVEVTKGAFDIRNQGSLGGTVNIVNKIPAPGLRVTPALAAGSFGYINPSITGSWARGATYVLAGHSYRRSDPYKDGRGKPFTSYTNFRDEAKNDAAFDVNTSWLKLGYAPTEAQKTSFGYTRQRAGRVLYPAMQMDALYDDADRLNASWSISDVGPVERIGVESYFTRVRHWMTDELRTGAIGAPRGFTMGTLAATKVLGGRIEAEFRGVTAGFEAYRRNWNTVNTMRMSGMYTDQHTLPNANLTLAGAYAGWRRTVLGRLHLTAGARLDRASSEARGPHYTDLYWAYNGSRALAADNTEPAANFRAAYGLTRGLELFAGAGHSARIPDPQERFYSLRRMSGSDWVGNPALRPVRNTEVDLGLNVRHRSFSLRPTVFYSHLRDYIVVHNQPRLNMAPLVMNAAAISYENVPARMFGGELAYSLGLHRSLVLLGGISQTRGTKDVLPARRIFDRDIAELPPLKARTVLRYGGSRFFAEVENIAASAQRRVDNDLREQPTAGYAIFNVKGGAHTAKLDLAVGIDNISNRFYYEHFSYQRDPFRAAVKIPEPGRTLYMTVSYAF